MTEIKAELTEEKEESVINLREQWFEYWNNTSLSENRLHQQWMCSFAVENNIPVPIEASKEGEGEKKEELSHQSFRLLLALRRHLINNPDFIHASVNEVRSWAKDRLTQPK